VRKAINRGQTAQTGRLPVKALIVAAVLLLNVVALAQTESIRAENDAAAETALRSAEDELGKLMVEGHVDEYASQLSDDFVATTSSGRVETKQEFISDVRSGGKKFLDFSSDDVQVHAYGDVAIVSGRRTAVVRAGGKVITSVSRFTDVFLKRDNHWWLASSQDTPLTK